MGLYEHALVQAKRLRDDTERCLAAIDWLIAHGFLPVLQNASQSVQPYVLIKTTPRIEQLKRRFSAEVSERVHDDCGPRVRMQVEINGCPVCWYESEVNPC
ncbi:hypothetical protein R0381_003617 [Jeongeupia wiesaeckerbachi]|uniref:hypothetical protein n=1 Tax=Jeongeupia wiesaeckerbachi TaxID=3051218 RepID=UPI003D802870